MIVINIIVDVPGALSHGTDNKSLRKTITFYLYCIQASKYSTMKRNKLIEQRL